MGLREILETNHIELKNSQYDQLETFKNLVLEKNKVMNLTAITNEEEFDYKHFLDSLIILHEVSFEGDKKVIDIGTGAGFPGMPLKIARPNLHITLLDSLKKRLVFLDECIKKLALTDIETVHARAEELGRNKSFREQYDIVISRAVANLNTLSEYDIPYVKVGGYFIAMKGKDGIEECKQAKGAIHTLGCQVERTKEYEIFGEKRVLILIKKVKKTDPKFPRGAGKPKKSPLR